MGFFESFMNRYSVLFTATFFISVTVLIFSHAFVKTFIEHFRELRLKNQQPSKLQECSFAFSFMSFLISGSMVLWHLILQGIHMFHMDFGS